MDIQFVAQIDAAADTGAIPVRKGGTGALVGPHGRLTAAARRAADILFGDGLANHSRPWL